MWVFLEGFYMLMMLYGSFIVISSSSWFVIWFGFELNMVSFIVFFGSSSKSGIESMFKYFFVQVLGSIFMLFFCMMLSFYMISDCLMEGYLSMGGILFFIMTWKLGGGPFFFWLPSVVEGLSWFGNFVLLTWQKIAPLWIIGLISFSQSIVIVFGLYSVIVGCFGGLNQLLMKKIFVYSSLAHMGWMFFMSYNSFFIMFYYYFFYLILSGSLIVFFFWQSKVHINQLYMVTMNFWVTSLLFMCLFSLGGLPPLLGIYPKWLGLLALLNMDYVFFCFLLLFLGVISLYYYLRLGYGWMLFLNYSCEWMSNMGKLSGFLVMMVVFSCFFLFYFSLMYL